MSWRRVLFVFLMGIVLAVPARAEKSRVLVLAGTSIVADVLQDLCGEWAEVRSLIPGGACPGHYDLRPGDLRFLHHADLLVLEPFQTELPNMQDLVRAAENKNLNTLVMPGVGAGMLPETQRVYSRALAARLARLWPERGSELEQAVAERVGRIDRVEFESRRELHKANALGTTALCSSMQKAFACWAGMAVAMEYLRPESMAPEDFEQLLLIGRERNVRVVLDNLQSGPGAGRGLAESLDAGQADLTSFPGALPGEDDWESAFRGNVQRLILALKQGHQ
ncbi:MAG: zinc ABC transporter substrate-binding protein [Desulfovibrionaceae bacterium]